MATSALQDFVNQQKTKSSSSFYNGFAGLVHGGNGLVNDLKGKLTTNSLTSAIPFYSKNSPSTGAVDEKSDGATTSNGAATKSGWFSVGKSESVFGLSRFQRIIGFFLCLIAGISCFTLASFYIPVLLFKARKFGALYTLGSCFFLFSFALLWGPYSFMGHLFSKPRLPMTLSYLFSLTATLYCSILMRSTILTVVCASVQVVTLIWFLLSYVPGGETGLRWMSSAFTKVVKRQVTSSSSSTANLLPV